MKYILITLSFIIASPGHASYFAKCHYESEISQIERLSTINTPVVGNHNTGKDNYTYVMHLKLSNGQAEPGSHIQKCELPLVKAIFNDKKKYQIGDHLKITITEMNNRSGAFSYSIVTK